LSNFSNPTCARTLIRLLLNRQNPGIAIHVDYNERGGEGDVYENEQDEKVAAHGAFLHEEKPTNGENGEHGETRAESDEIGV